jgi:hypothetical protein
MQAPSALIFPVRGHGNGVAGEYGRVVHAALAQTNTLAVFQVNGRNQ